MLRTYVRGKYQKAVAATLAKDSGYWGLEFSDSLPDPQEKYSLRSTRLCSALSHRPADRLCGQNRHKCGCLGHAFLGT